jgi:hypothetical protein
LLIDLVLESIDSHLMQQSTVVDIAEDKDYGRITCYNMHQPWSSIQHEENQSCEMNEGHLLQQLAVGTHHII